MSLPGLKPFYGSTQVLEAGCDEAGRGCLAGPVAAAAVILPRGFEHPWLRDSKQLSSGQREVLRPFIESHAVAWAVGWASVAEIDELNILQASLLAMHRALEQLSVLPELVLVDGNRFKPYREVPYRCVVGGDGVYQSVAAASVLAKTHRDAVMMTLHAHYPQYDWHKNYGYPTTSHRKAIAMYGPTEHHRKSFRLLPQPDLFTILSEIQP